MLKFSMFYLVRNKGIDLLLKKVNLRECPLI